MGTISFTRRVNFEKNQRSLLDSFVNVHWCSFTTGHAHRHFLENLEKGQENLKESFKHFTVPDYILYGLRSYYDGKMKQIENDHTQFAYKIFGNFYSVVTTWGNPDKNVFERYDKVFPREVWTHPDFGKCGNVIWTKSLKDFYENSEEREVFPKMTFRAKDGFCEYAINNIKGVIGNKDLFSYEGEMDKWVKIMSIVNLKQIRLWNVTELL